MAHVKPVTTAPCTAEITTWASWAAMVHTALSVVVAARASASAAAHHATTVMTATLVVVVMVTVRTTWSTSVLWLLNLIDSRRDKTVLETRVPRHEIVVCKFVPRFVEQLWLLLELVLLHDAVEDVADGARVLLNLNHLLVLRPLLLIVDNQGLLHLVHVHCFPATSLINQIFINAKA